MMQTVTEVSTLIWIGSMLLISMLLYLVFELLTQVALQMEIAVTAKNLYYYDCVATGDSRNACVRY